MDHEWTKKMDSCAVERQSLLITSTFTRLLDQISRAIASTSGFVLADHSPRTSTFDSHNAVVDP